MTQLSDTDLAEGNIDLWFSWLRTSLMTYTREGSLRSRYRAFAPLVVDPQSGNPASDIVQQIRTVSVERSGVVEAAAIEALRSWSLSSDGWVPAALLISVAARLGGRGVADAIWELLARSGDLPPDARAELAYVAVQAATLRFKFSEIVSLARLLWSEELATPQLVGIFAVLLSRKDNGGLRMMPERLIGMLPALIEPPHEGEYVRAVANALRQTFMLEDLLPGLSPVQDEARLIADFRGVLLSLTVPMPRHDNIVQLKEVLSQRQAERLSAMNDLAELPPPPAPRTGSNPDGSERS